jgi:hypothetical protein
MFRVTLRHLDRTASHAHPDHGECELGLVAPEAFTALLETFRQLDPIENNEAEPEILVEHRGARHLVRTAASRLTLHNARHLEDPALALSAAEILAELDGSASAARRAATLAYTATLAPFPVAVEEPAYVPPPRPKEKPSWAIATVAAVMGLAVVFQLVSAHEAATASTQAPAWLTAADGLEAEQATLAGVYLTGPKPGDHGIAIDAAGALKIFQLNAAIAPSLVNDTYRLGRVGGKLVLATAQPGGLIVVQDRDTLGYCGELFRRVP